MFRNAYRTGDTFIISSGKWKMGIGLAYY